MRLSKIEFAPRAESGPIFDFYMGKNTPERKDYIMDSLVVPVEEQAKVSCLPQISIPPGSQIFTSNFPKRLA